MEEKLKLIEIDVLENPTSALVYNEYVSQCKPVVLKSAAKSWRAYKEWPSLFLSKRYQDIEVNTSRGDANNSEEEFKSFRLAEYLKYITDTKDTDPFYLSGWSFSATNSELLLDYEIPEYFNNWLRRVPDELLHNEGQLVDYLLRWIYIGAKNTGSAMHRDICDTSAWNAVISGKKEWLFYDLEQTENIHDGYVDAFNPDFTKYPKLKNAVGYTCIQEAGDIVYTPSMWWHQVRNLEGGISLTENFVNSSNIHCVSERFRSEKDSYGLSNLYDGLLQFIPELQTE